MVWRLKVCFLSTTSVAAFNASSSSVPAPPTALVCVIVSMSSQHSLFKQTTPESVDGRFIPAHVLIPPVVILE